MTKSPATVLVVEANPLLRLFVNDLVVANGCTALTASTADEAMTILQTRPDIALLITNVVMGGSLNGVELAHAVDRRWPQVRVIVTSAHPGLSDSHFPPRCHYMPKPYHDDELGFEIRARAGSPHSGLAHNGAQL